MKLPLQEPIAPRYIYINPKTNVVHLLMPIMSGTEIGLDNTCKSVYSLQEFFGLLGANQQSAASRMLKDYQEALAFDIKYHPDSEEKSLKTQRLEQINSYLRLLQQAQQEKQITSPLTLVFPAYPAALESLMQAREGNLYSMILRPKEQDVQLRTTAISPVFSAHHNYIVNGQVIIKESLLYEGLSNRYEGLVFTLKSKEQLIAQVLSKCPDNIVVNFEWVKELLTQEIRTSLGIDVDFNQTQGSLYAPSVPVTQAYMDEELDFGVNNPRTYQGYIEALIEYCAPNLFDVVKDSPFDMINNKEKLSILTQFFLAELNITCHEEGITKANFGQILEDNPDLISNLAESVKQALAHNASVEDALVDYVNQHRDDFQLRSPIPQGGIPNLKERFKSHYNTIKDSPHFDEFMLLSTKEGAFVAHQGCIATHFAYFMQTGFFYDILAESEQTFLQSVQRDFATANKPENVLPHRNEHIHTGIKEVNLDLSKMDKDTLQTLYEDINSYQDPKLKEALLAQLKQERPDFKPQIDAKAFLQHVAYGEQDEAEALLKKDPELAQELLRTNNIHFTDYSGRTFTCTAYEYAYWAKDSHMQRMLENYIRQDEETRQLMFEQVKAIEELVNPPAAEGFFAIPKPRGLHYTTQDKEGQTIDHWEAHFDLTPLKTALKHYVDEYNNRPNKSDDDWEQLDKIWVEKVGIAQRSVPAHIAQEYCHPERSFYNITQSEALLDVSNPNNLKRQLKFYNKDTGNYDLWFTPDSYAVDSRLGFSFAILRGGEPLWGMWRAPSRAESHRRAWRGDLCEIDLAILSVIDKVRIRDLKQSLENLSQPLIAQVAQYPGI
ncbi:hypothetical protein Lsan_3108 [Legionella santicrucis]|uniref:SidC N-terminal domain-containing protein n=1 Tax=Legionella santicrucis TaxID=45074 RepID=A0A0W0YFX2_9GAMM|nr:hypothetical protein [Legionella santicrucis]KTD55556.1 hypothetical protein Lsan_3108 [Legionella santicrucis]